MFLPLEKNFISAIDVEAVIIEENNNNTIPINNYINIIESFS